MNITTCECCGKMAHEESAEVFDLGRGVDGLLACVECALTIKEAMIVVEDRDGAYFDAVCFWEGPEALTVLRQCGVVDADAFLAARC